MKTLQVIETAYRATVEEQDDPILWMTQAMKDASGELSVLLCGNAVSYATQEQSAEGLHVGSWHQRHPPDIGFAIESLQASGVEILAVEDDLQERGILNSRLVEGVKKVPRSALARFYEQFERVWHW